MNYCKYNIHKNRSDFPLLRIPDAGFLSPVAPNYVDLCLLPPSERPLHVISDFLSVMMVVLEMGPTEE